MTIWTRYSTIFMTILGTVFGSNANVSYSEDSVANDSSQSAVTTYSITEIIENIDEDSTEVEVEVDVDTEVEPDGDVLIAQAVDETDSQVLEPLVEDNDNDDDFVINDDVVACAEGTEDISDPNDPNEEILPSTDLRPIDKVLYAQIMNKTYKVDESLDETSKRLHEYLKGKRLFKITNMDESHNHFHYKTGLNQMKNGFDYQKKCGYGGLYFAKEGDILHFLTWGVYYREIFLHPSSKLVKVDGDSNWYQTKFKTDKFVMGERHLIDKDFINEQTKIATTNVKNACSQSETNIIKTVMAMDRLRNAPDDANITDYSASINTVYMNFHLKYVHVALDENVPDNIRNHIYRRIIATKSYYLKRNSTFHPRYIVRPDEENAKKFLELNPQYIRYIKDPTEEMYKKILTEYPNLIRLLDEKMVDGIDDTTLDSIHKDILDNGRVYDMANFNKVNNQIQDKLIAANPLNIILITNPSEQTLEKIKDVPACKMYYDMFHEGPQKYILKSIPKYDSNMAPEDNMITAITTTDSRKNQPGHYWRSNSFNEFKTYHVTHDPELNRQFMSRLKSCNGVISGSFAVKMLMSMTDDTSKTDPVLSDIFQNPTNTMNMYSYMPSDVDLYFSNMEDAMKFSRYLEDFEYLRTNIIKYNAYNIMGSHVGNIISMSCMNPNKSYAKIGKIQLIVINKEVNIINYIMTYFDINYCKVAIDGDYNIYKFDGEGKQISENIFNILGIFKNNTDAIMSKIDYRLAQYAVKGVKLWQYNGGDISLFYAKKLINSTNCYLRKVNRRILKYKNRGVKFDNANMERFITEVAKVREIIRLQVYSIMY